jgi:hypothetical protein
MLSQERIADPSQKIGNRIGHRHRSESSPFPFVTGSLPTGLDHPRNFAAQGPQPKADAAHLEFP